VATVTGNGYQRVPDAELAAVVADVIAGRMADPGGGGVLHELEGEEPAAPTQEARP
jgi:hypothetical protein